MRLSGERVRPYQSWRSGFGLSGLLVILTHTDGTTTPLGSCSCWSRLSLLGRRQHRRAPDRRHRHAALRDLGSLFSAPPLFVLSFALEGWPAIRAGLAQADATDLGRRPLADRGQHHVRLCRLGLALCRAIRRRSSPRWRFSCRSSAWAPRRSSSASRCRLWKVGAAALVMSGLVLGLLYPRWAEPAGLTVDLHRRRTGPKMLGRDHAAELRRRRPQSGPPTALEDVYWPTGSSLAVSLLIAAIATMGQSRRFGALMAGSSLLPLQCSTTFTLTDGFADSAAGFLRPCSCVDDVSAPLLVMGLVVALVGPGQTSGWVGPGRYVGMGVSVLVGAYNMSTCRVHCRGELDAARGERGR